MDDEKLKIPLRGLCNSFKKGRREINIKLDLKIRELVLLNNNP